jgi:phosphonate transport system ATP-binding protein
MLEIKELSVAYPQAGTVLSSISLSVGCGEFLVLLGRSGAGKSSLLRAINYLVCPVAGSIFVAGIGNLGSTKSLQAHRRQTGMVFQQHQLVLRLTALDNVLLGCVGRYSTWRSLGPFRNDDVALAFDSLESVGLTGCVHRRADALSGGQRQRVGIARALAQRPKLLLVDEPVASLDPQTADQIMTLLRDIGRAQRLATIVSLHQLDLARRYADRIVGLAGGRVVFDGTAADLGETDVAKIYGNASLAETAAVTAGHGRMAASPIFTDLEHQLSVQDE